jgi:hypothetical protein
MSAAWLKTCQVDLLFLSRTTGARRPIQSTTLRNYKRSEVKQAPGHSSVLASVKFTVLLRLI